MIDQLIMYLDTMPYEYIGIQTQHLGTGMIALCVRWSACLTTLLDESAPLHPDPDGVGKRQSLLQSFITDGEMKRMNIEVSHNLYRLVQLYRERGLQGLQILLAKAYLHLPMPQRAVRMDRELGQQLVASLMSVRPRVHDHRVATIPVEHADRVIANVFALWGWRNTEIENIHAGEPATHPLRPHQRRLRQLQARRLLRENSSKFGPFYLWFGTFFADTSERRNVPLFHDLPAWPDTSTAPATSFLGMQSIGLVVD
jgi:hypothetical protein